MQTLKSLTEGLGLFFRSEIFQFLIFLGSEKPPVSFGLWIVDLLFLEGGVLITIY